MRFSTNSDLKFFGGWMILVALPVGEVGDMALATEANGRSGRDVGKSGGRLMVRFVVGRCGRAMSLAFARGDETEGRDEMTAAGGGRVSVLRAAGEQENTYTWRGFVV